MTISTKVTPPLAVLPDIDVPWAGAKMIVDFSTRRVMTHSRSGAQCHGVCNTWAELMSGLDGDPNVCTMPLGPCVKGKARRASANFVPAKICTFSFALIAQPIQPFLTVCKIFAANTQPVILMLIQFASTL